MSAPLLKLYSMIVVVVLFVSANFFNGIKHTFPSKIQTPKEIKNTAIYTTATNETATGTTTHSEISIATTSENPTTTIVIEKKEIPKENTSTNTQEIDVSLERGFSTNKPFDVCTGSVTYKIGRFDSGFEISKKSFEEALRNASGLWNEAIGRNMITYDTNGSITVNLIYDKRQQETKDNQLLTAEIKNTEDTAAGLKKEFEDLEKTFTTMKDDYLTKVTAFNTDQKTYNDTVQDWNNKGGAPQADYDKLMSEKDRLQKVNESLLVTQNQLNDMLKEINSRITRYNELVLYANDNVSLNNKIARKKFTEGQYIPQTNEIDIYQFTDDIKLERVLAHEFGHALGLDHNKNKESIMYAVNSASTKMLSKEDIRGLKALCN